MPSLPTAPELTSYPPSPRGLPPDLVKGRYRLAWVRGPEELAEVLRLRFEVFNIEMGEGLEESFATGLDEDPFDAGCHHMVVRHEDTGEAVGTYRVQTRAMADLHRGFYSAGEFRLDDLPSEVLSAAVEVGRACVAAECRQGQVLLLLWKGLMRYLSWNRQRYFFGCCSLPTQDPRVAARALAALRRDGHVDGRHVVRPVPACVCDTADDDGEAVDLPPLMQMYLRYGAKICSGPAVDREFGTIDFFTLLDAEQMDPVSRRTLSWE